MEKKLLNLFPLFINHFYFFKQYGHSHFLLNFIQIFPIMRCKTYFMCQQKYYHEDTFWYWKESSTKKKVTQTITPTISMY